MKEKNFEYQFEGMKHDVLSKLAMNCKLEPEEKCFYLLFIANEKEMKRFLKNEKNKDNH